MWFIVLAILVAGLVWGLIEYYWIEVTRLRVNDFNPSHEVPMELRGQRIVYLSDFQFDHAKTGFRHKAIAQVVERTNAFKPDLILFGGDLIHKKNRHNHHIESYLRQFDAPIIAILGNHDYYDIDYVKELYERLGIEVLINESIDYCGMQILGVDDLRIGKPVVPEVKDGFSLLLTHSADVVETMDVQVDMALAGHFHGGMVTFFGLYAPIIKSAYKKKYQYGMVQAPTTKIYVGRGLGGYVFWMPMRFFARPELIVIDF